MSTDPELRSLGYDCEFVVLALIIHYCVYHSIIPARKLPADEDEMGVTVKLEELNSGLTVRGRPQSDLLKPKLFDK